MKETCIFLVAALAGACCNAMAEGVVTDDSAPVTTLNEVEIVATRATNRTPVAFTNVTAEELAKSNTGVDLPYMLQGTPSVIMTSDAGTGVGYTSIRVRGTDGSRINVTANGIPINDAESHNVYWVNMPDFASTLQDVQIQRGVGTSTNGAGAFGASINMLTASAARDPYSQLDASYGMYNTNKQTLRIGSGLIGGHWAVDARLSHIGSDGYIQRASSKLWSYYGQASYYNEGTSLKFISFGGKERTYNAWDYATKEQIEKYGRRYNPCGEYTDSDGNIAYYPNQYDNYAQYHFQMIYNQMIGEHFNLNFALHYTKGDGYYEQYKTSQKFKKYGLKPYYIISDEDASSVKVDRSDLIRHKNMDNGFGGGIFSLKYRNGSATAIVGGGINNFRGHHFGQIAWVRNYLGALDPLQEYYRNKADKLDGNIYGRLSIDITNHLTGYADLQYRHIDYKIRGIGDNFDDGINDMERLDIHHTFNFFNPKAGLQYDFDHNNRLFASFSVAHREPTRDNYIDCPPNREPVAERLYDYELGYTFQSERVNAGASFYYMDYKDQLVPTGQLSDTGNTVSENVGKSYRAGIELFAGYQPVKWFDWQFTTTLSRNRIKDYVQYIYGDAEPMLINRHETPISCSPDLTLHNAFNFRYSGFEASLQSRYVSRQYLDNSGDRDISLDPYFVSDLHLGYTFHNIASLSELRLGFIAYNLFNEKYESAGWAYSYYYTDDSGKKVIGNDAGYAVQAPLHVMGTISIIF